MHIPNLKRLKKVKCKCGALVELERMNFIYQEGRNIRVERICECEKGHCFKKEVKARRKKRKRPLDKVVFSAII